MVMPAKSDVEEVLLLFRTCRRVVLNDIVQRVGRGEGIRNPFLTLSRLFARVKSADSVLEKMGRKGITVAAASEIPQKITDILGFRIIVESAEEAQVIQRFLEDSFEVTSSSNQLEHRGQLGERGLELGLRCQVGDGICPFEIQVRTFLQHYWASQTFHLFHKKSPDVALKHREALISLSESLHSADTVVRDIGEDMVGSSDLAWKWRDLPLCSQVNLVVVERGEMFRHHEVISLTGEDDRAGHRTIVQRKLELYESYPGCAIVECSCLNFLSFLLNEPVVRVPLSRWTEIVM